jgi:D-cysteine desulfhydrase
MLKPKKVIMKTPIEEIRGIQKGKKIYVKRDDLTGFLISGNKARKLEYLVADAMNKKCDTLITCGGIQSNHCRTTVAFAQKFGFDCHLFLRVRGKPKKVYTGNLLIERLLGAKIHYITPTQYTRRNEIMNDYALKLKRRGRNPYVIPVGGSNRIGSLGYIGCMKEMEDFLRRKKIEAVYVAVGSGGTYAGLLLGKKLLDLTLDLNGIIVCDTVEYFSQKVSEICANIIRERKLKLTLDPDEMHFIDGYIGKGYAIPYQDSLKTINRLAKSGIFLDPVYTGKAFHGMLHHCRKKKYKRILFVHTGGIFSIFAYSKDLSKIINM